MSALVEGKRAKRTVLLIAAVLLGLAIWLLTSANRDDELQKITDTLKTFGYMVYDDELYIAGDYPDTTIAALLGEVDLEAAAAASRAAGFPSDVHKRGDVVPILAAMRGGDVITLYMLNGEMELCFIQRPGSSAVFPLGADAAAEAEEP